MLRLARTALAGAASAARARPALACTRMARLATAAPRNPYLTRSAYAALQATGGTEIECKAAVAWEPNAPLDVTTVRVAPPREGEVRVKVVANALCHTDIYTLEGHDPEGLFPCILGHEAAALVESVGPGVSSVEVGDVVIPCYTPECKQPECVFCESEKTNLCPTIRATQGQGVMPDGTSRFSKDGQDIFHFMGCSTFSEYTVIAEISAARISPAADLNHACMLGCGLSTGWGAVHNNCKVEAGSSVAVFGLGALGLAVIQASKAAGARYIVGVDTNSGKFDRAAAFGADECVNPKEVSSARDWLLERPGCQWGYDYTFDCTGSTDVMREALEVAHRGWGESCVIGVAAAGHEISTRPFQLVTGRVWRGTAFGGWKSRTEVPQLVQTVMRGEADIKPYVTHWVDGLERVNDAVDALHGGECLRAVVRIADAGMENVPAPPELLSNDRVHGGHLKRLKHWSESNHSEMTLSVFVPEQRSRSDPPPPVLIYLSGLTCTDDNARTKSMFQRLAAKYNLAMVFPDTSSRGTGIEGATDSYDFGEGAGFYVDSTTAEWQKHNNMYSYVTAELPALVERLFPVDMQRCSVMGHSMGGHGALVAHLRNPGKYKSVSAFAPICNPTESEWGRKAFEGYLGSVEAGAAYDAVRLVEDYEGPHAPILIDQGSHDEFLPQLHPDRFRRAAAAAGYDAVRVRMQDGYNHSYFFVSTFMEDHIRHHAASLGLVES